MKKTNLYIDGTNLFAGQNELFGPKNYLSFNFLLDLINKLYKINQAYFYATYMKRLPQLNKKTKALLTTEALFYKEVRKNPKVIFYKGHRSPTSGKEKGVDVHLAVDIVKDVLLKKCQQVVIMTGDADLIYPLEIVKNFGVDIGAVFLPNRFSLEMCYKVENCFVLNFLNKFKMTRKLPKQLKIITIKKPRMINIRGM